MKRENDYRRGYEDAVQDHAAEMRRVRNEFKRYKKHHLFKRKAKKDKFDIKIVFKDKKDNPFCDNIRKSLNQYGNNCFIVPYDRYKEKTSGTADYTVFYGNIDHLETAKYRRVLDEAGCVILTSHANIIMTRSEDTGMSQQEFIKYYQEVVKTELDVSYDEKEAAKMVADYQKMEGESGEAVLAWVERQCNKMSKFLNIAEGKSELLGKIIAICFLPPAIAIAMLAVPAGISEIVYEETLKGLNGKKFLSKALPEAQKQILLIRLCQYIRELQMGSNP